jgi:hypothetical protein
MLDARPECDPRRDRTPALDATLGAVGGRRLGSMTGPEPDLDALAAAIAMLSAEYDAALPGRIADIRRALEHARKGGAAGRDELVDELHRLAGTAGTFGHPDVSDRARALEVALQARRRRGAGTGPTGREGRVLDDVAAFADELALRFHVDASSAV